MSVHEGVVEPSDAAEPYVAAVYAIASALRDAATIDDVAAEVAHALARATASRYAALHLRGRCRATVGPGSPRAPRVAMPLVASSGAVGAVVIARATARDPRFRELLAHVATELDAHDRRHREAQLGAAREKRWRALLSVLTQVVWVADASGAFVVPQPSWEAYTGQPWSAHRGFGWVDALHPDDRARAKSGWARAVAGSDVWQASGRIFHARTGEWRAFVARATPLFDEGGAVREWVGTLTDVHDVERAERERAGLLERAERERARMYQLFDRAPALIAIQRGKDHVLEFVNASMQRVVGGTGAVGRPLADVFPFEHYLALADQVLETGKRVIGTELPLRRDWDGDGGRQDRWFNFVHEPMIDEGRALGVMSFGFDVTDLVTARRRVEAAVRELEATSRAKDEFLATVSHELRTPLGSILGWASLLSERFDDPDAVAKGADVIHRSARAQARIIDDILDVSRIITGKLRIDARPVSLEGVVKSALEVVRPSASAKNMDIDVVLPDEPCTVVGDEERLRQVVWNLLSNAIKFTERGGRVSVKLARSAASVTLEVTDTGRGIAPEFLPHVFERFRQADSSTTRAQGGLGLGLAIVRHLVELHGGHVEVTSGGLGQGATFSATLPIRAVVPKSESAPIPAPTSTPSVPRNAPPSSHDELEGARVLVVDDELDAREMLGMALSAWGVDVRTAESASDAMRAVAEQMPDVVISDIGMPGEDGYAFVKRLRTLCRERGLHVTAVALTAYARREDAARAIAAGFDFHVAKPIELDDLRVVVERALQRN